MIADEAVDVFDDYVDGDTGGNNNNNNSYVPTSSNSETNVFDDETSGYHSIYISVGYISGDTTSSYAA